MMVKRKSPTKLLLIGGLLALGGGAWWYLAHKESDNANKKPAVAVRVTPVERRDVPLTLKNVGTVVPYETVGVRSRIDSQLLEVRFKDGDYVNKGDILFILDDREPRAKVAEMEANLARDRAQAQNLRLQYERSSKLAKQGFQSQANLDQAKASFTAQNATAAATEASIQDARVQLAFTKIEAPISGRTGTINVTLGNNVKTNDAQPLVTINQIKPIRAQVSLPQQYLDQVREAMASGAIEVTAVKSDNATTSIGTLEYIDNNVDQGTGTFAARAAFPNEDEKLWPGMFVNLVITLGEEKQVLTIPEVAVQRGQDGDFVFVVNGGTAQKRPVKIARLQDTFAVITDGLKEQEQVVVDGVMSLKEGSTVNAQQAEKTPAAAAEKPAEPTPPAP